MLIFTCSECESELSVIKESLEMFGVCDECYSKLSSCSCTGVMDWCDYCQVFTSTCCGIKEDCECSIFI